MAEPEPAATSGDLSSDAALASSDVRRALEEFYAAHAEQRARKSRRTAPADHTRIAPEHHETFARWLYALARDAGLKLRPTAMAAVRAWFTFPGKDGCLASAWWPLSMLMTQDGRDLHKIGERVLAERLAHLEENFPGAPPPRVDPVVRERIVREGFQPDPDAAAQHAARRRAGGMR